VAELDECKCYAVEMSSQASRQNRQ